MNNKRFIAKLDVKGSNLVKGIQYEGLRKLGEPHEFAKRYYDQGIDEILYLDIVASLYNRNNLSSIVEKSVSDIFVPITVGGGLRCLDDVEKALESGADKVAINTAAIKNPDIITQVADTYGSQCMVLSVQAKRNSLGKWEVYYDNGRERTGIDVIEWIKQGYERGAGEVLLTSVDCEGTMKGFDYELIDTVTNIVQVPIIICGGMSSEDDFVKAVEFGADAVVAASILHYGKKKISDIKDYALKAGINVRKVEKDKD